MLLTEPFYIQKRPLWYLKGMLPIFFLLNRATENLRGFTQQQPHREAQNAEGLILVRFVGLAFVQWRKTLVRPTGNSPREMY